MMKNRALIVGLLLALAAALLAGCAKTAATEKEMIDLVRPELRVSEAEKIGVTALGRVEKGDAALLCLMTGGEYQGHLYFAAWFSQKNGRYSLEHVAEMYPRGTDLYSYSWRDGYAFAANNPNCAGIRVVSQSGEVIEYPVESIPFFTYYDRFPSEYNFLDVQGNELP